MLKRQVLLHSKRSRGSVPPHDGWFTGPRFHQSNWFITVGRPPRLLRICTRVPCPLECSSRRNAAAEFCWRAAKGRNAMAQLRPFSAASCKRRFAWSSSVSGHSNTAAQVPDDKACSADQRISLAFLGRTISMRDKSIPYCCSAGGYGWNGGATQAIQPGSVKSCCGDSALKLASAGINRRSSPMP